MSTRSIDIRQVGPEQWTQLADFFGPSGGYSGCWCVWWRRTSAEFDAGCRDGARGNRAVLRQLTAEACVPGLLAYVAGEPVGWVSVSPRTEFGRVLRSPALKPRDGRGMGIEGRRTTQACGRSSASGCLGPIAAPA